MNKGLIVLSEIIENKLSSSSAQNVSSSIMTGKQKE